MTPYIVHAVDPNQVVRPDQNFQDASDPQTWFLGRVEPDLFDFAVTSTDAGVLRQDRIHHPVGLAALRQDILRTEKDSSHGRSSL